jgi:excisionase family DNA binding protein
MNTAPVSYTRSGAIIASGLHGATIEKAIDDGELKAIRSGRRLIILAEDLVAWLRRGRDRGEIATPRPDQAANQRLAEENRKRKAAGEARRARRQQRAAA